MEKKDPLIWGALLRLFIILASLLITKEGEFANPHYDGVLDFGDIKFVWEKYAQWIWEGYIPYVDFNVEFPPFFVAIIMVPFVIFKVVGIFPYEIWFAFWNLTADLLILKILKDLKGGIEKKSTIDTIIWVWALFPPIPLLLLARFDSWPILFLLLAIKKEKSNKFWQASAIATIGSLMKFFPAIYLIVATTKVLKGQFPQKSMIMGFFVGMFPLGIILLIWPNSWDGLLWIFEFHLNKDPYSTSIMGSFYHFLGDRWVFRPTFSILYVLAILGCSIYKSNETGIFYSLNVFAIFNWHYTPQYFLWPFVFGYLQNRKQILLVSFLFSIAFGFQTYVNIYTYTYPGYLPSLH